MNRSNEEVGAILDAGLEFAEQRLFNEFAGRRPNDTLPLIFVVCSPRVGSTLIYQLLINRFGCSFVSNFVNDYFGSRPAVGIAHQYLADYEGKVDYYSEYGKTRGIFETSEASAVFSNWFGGKQPSETHSADFLSLDKKEHMRKSVSAIHGITGRIFVAKNPWNSFRIKSLSEAFKGAYFIWARRSLEKAAISDLENRYKRGSPTHWNSATTANYREIQKLPYWEQVVEQQYHYNLSISKALKNYANDRHCSVWYEDLCADPMGELGKIELELKNREYPVDVPKEVNAGSIRESPGAAELLKNDFGKIHEFIERNRERYDWMIHRTNVAGKGNKRTHID